MERTNKFTFIFHYRIIPQWLEQSPIAFALLALFARRARREVGEIAWNGELIQLKPRQFITGRLSVSKELGISEGEYRGAYNKLLRYGLIRTSKATSRYTIGLYCADGIFSINPSDQSPSEEPTDLPTDNQSATTNNNDNNVNNDSNKFKSRLDKSFEESAESTPYKEELNPEATQQPTLTESPTEGTTTHKNPAISKAIEDARERYPWLRRRQK